MHNKDKTNKLYLSRFFHSISSVRSIRKASPEHLHLHCRPQEYTSVLPFSCFSVCRCPPVALPKVIHSLDRTIFSRFFKLIKRFLIVAVCSSPIIITTSHHKQAPSTASAMLRRFIKPLKRRPRTILACTIPVIITSSDSNLEHRFLLVLLRISTI